MGLKRSYEDTIKEIQRWELGAIAAPQWIRGDMDAATSEVAVAVLWVVIVLAVIPWRYVITQYMRHPGDPWRSEDEDGEEKAARSPGARD